MCFRMMTICVKGMKHTHFIDQEEERYLLPVETIEV